MEKIIKLYYSIKSELFYKYSIIKSYYDEPVKWQKNFEKKFLEDQQYFVKYIDKINLNIDLVVRKDKSIEIYRKLELVISSPNKIIEEKTLTLNLVSNKIHNKVDELLFDKYTYRLCSDLYLYSNFLYEIFSNECRSVINYTNKHYDEVFIYFNDLKNAELEYIGVMKEQKILPI